MRADVIGGPFDGSKRPRPSKKDRLSGMDLAAADQVGKTNLWAIYQWNEKDRNWRYMKSAVATRPSEMLSAMNEDPKGYISPEAMLEMHPLLVNKKPDVCLTTQDIADALSEFAGWSVPCPTEILDPEVVPERMRDLLHEGKRVGMVFAGMFGVLIPVVIGGKTEWWGVKMEVKDE